MKKLITSIAGITFLVLVGCAQPQPQPQPQPRPQYYYSTSSLNQIRIGQTKESILLYFAERADYRSARPLPGMVIRAAQRSSRGKLLEVGTVFLSDGVTPDVVSHWLMFEDGVLVQWGRPEDWKKAALRYDINFNPLPGVLPQ